MLLIPEDHCNTWPTFPTHVLHMTQGRAQRLKLGRFCTKASVVSVAFSRGFDYKSLLEQPPRWPQISKRPIGAILTHNNYCVLTTRTPDKLPKSWSWNCSDTVQGMRSPEARFPRDKPAAIDVLLISPSRQICSKQQLTDTSEVLLEFRVISHPVFSNINRTLKLKTIHLVATKQRANRNRTKKVTWRNIISWILNFSLLS